MANPQRAIDHTKKKIAKAHGSGRKIGGATARGAAVLGGGTGGFLFGFIQGAIDTVKELLPEGEEDEEVSVGVKCARCGETYVAGTKFCPQDGSPIGLPSNGAVTASA